MSKGLRNVLGAAALMVMAIATAGESLAGQPDQTPPAGAPRMPGAPVILVTGGENPGLYYDTILLGTLPFQGPFQELDAANGETEYGPGDPEYAGGRWWVDGNGNGTMDDPETSTDFYFLCPLLGPGRETP